MCQINDKEEENQDVANQFIAHIKAKSTKSTEKGWHLFNDFQIVSTSRNQVVKFNTYFKVKNFYFIFYFKFIFIFYFYFFYFIYFIFIFVFFLEIKNPCVLVYTMLDLKTVIPVPKLNKELRMEEERKRFFQPNPLSKFSEIPEEQKKNYFVLKEEDIPKNGDLLAIDSEFVSLNPEEVIEMKDGTLFVKSPAHLALARVSVITEDGKKIIDDLIFATTEVHDYLTRFSGINKGDLDPKNSPFIVTTLKVKKKIKKKYKNKK